MVPRIYGRDTVKEKLETDPTWPGYRKPTDPNFKAEAGIVYSAVKQAQAKPLPPPTLGQTKSIGDILAEITAHGRAPAEVGNCRVEGCEKRGYIRDGDTWLCIDHMHSHATTPKYDPAKDPKTKPPYKTGASLEIPMIATPIKSGNPPKNKIKYTIIQYDQPFLRLFNKPKGFIPSRWLYLRDAMDDALIAVSSAPVPPTPPLTPKPPKIELMPAWEKLPPMVLTDAYLVVSNLDYAILIDDITEARERRRRVVQEFGERAAA